MRESFKSKSERILNGKAVQSAAEWGVGHLIISLESINTACPKPAREIATEWWISWSAKTQTRGHCKPWLLLTNCVKLRGVFCCCFCSLSPKRRISFTTLDDNLQKFYYKLFNPYLVYDFCKNGNKILLLTLYLPMILDSVLYDWGAWLTTPCCCWPITTWMFE